MKPCKKCGNSDRYKSGRCRPCWKSYVLKWNKANPNKKYAIYLKGRTKTQIRRNNRRKTNLQYRLSTTLRSRIIYGLKANQKTGSAVRDLGCSIEELKTHLESLWSPGMDWASWGSKGWHIDHIVPLSSFDLTNREQFLKACHYTNLQPLWASDNLRKGSHNV